MSDRSDMVPRVVTHPVAAMAAAEIGPRHPVWQTGADVAAVVAGVRGGFVWVEPPPGVDPTGLVERLREVAAVKVAPAAAEDAVVAEAVFEAPVAVACSIRAVVGELMAAAQVSPEDRVRLEAVVDAALTGVGR
jgi:hypothetical protein